MFSRREPGKETLNLLSNQILKTSLAGPHGHSNLGAARTPARSASTSEDSLVCLGKKLFPVLVVLGSDF